MRHCHGLIIQGTDRREIKKALTKAETYLKDALYGIDLKVARVDGRKFVLTV